MCLVFIDFSQKEKCARSARYIDGSFTLNICLVGKPWWNKHHFVVMPACHFIKCVYPLWSYWGLGPDPGVQTAVPGHALGWHHQGHTQLEARFSQAYIVLAINRSQQIGNQPTDAALNMYDICIYTIMYIVWFVCIVSMLGQGSKDSCVEIHYHQASYTECDLV